MCKQQFPNTSTCLKLVSRRLFLFLDWELFCSHSKERKSPLIAKKARKKGHHTRLRENEELPHWKVPTLRQIRYPEIMRS